MSGVDRFINFTAPYPRACGHSVHYKSDRDPRKFRKTADACAAFSPGRGARARARACAHARARGKFLRARAPSASVSRCSGRSSLPRRGSRTTARPTGRPRETRALPRAGAVSGPPGRRCLPCCLPARHCRPPTEVGPPRGADRCSAPPPPAAWAGLDVSAAGKTCVLCWLRARASELVS